MAIIIDPLVTQKQTELFDALIENGYFATAKAAKAYMKGIGDFIKSLPKQTARRTKNNSYGAFYAVYKANRHTTWYILFDIEADIWFVRNLINNHTPDYPELIAGFIKNIE